MTNPWSPYTSPRWLLIMTSFSKSQADRPGKSFLYWKAATFFWFCEAIINCETAWLQRSSRIVSACRKRNHGLVAAVAPAFNCCPRPRGATMTVQPWFFAIESVSSDDPPSAMMISPTTPVSGFKQWANSDASFSVGIITDMFGRAILE